MRRSLVVASLVLLGWVTLGSGAPVEGPAVALKVGIEPYGRQSFPLTFKAGEQAKVIASGNQQTYLGLYIYDDQGNCVARDDMGDTRTRDDLAVEWYPPSTSEYTIEVRNFGPMANVFQIAFR
jgi:hypothetical protein